LTNKGPFHVRFEKELADHLDVDHLALFANGTLALVTALQALRITGEVITTPYSFVATAHSLLWNNIEPVFADIDPISLNLDPNRIEEAITPKTTAILPVHVYGRPCEVEKIEHIADIYGLKVIYDAAHSFGVCNQGKSLLNRGDLSVLSFHATKVFTTFEGGAIVCPDSKTKQRIDYLKNFGFANEVTVVAPGINGKMNEFQSALGLLQLKHFENVIEKRKRIHQGYSQCLSDIDGIRTFPIPDDVQSNYGYFPILIEPNYGLSRDELYQKLKDQGIYARRYFFPLISEFPMYRGFPSACENNLPIATSVSRKIICLPIYPSMEDKDTDLVIAIIRACMKAKGNIKYVVQNKGS
jgi:dTDP-4-amino-4,6-dideoxygalactose transaminase